MKTRKTPTAGRESITHRTVEGRLILKKQNGRAWIGFIWLRIRRRGGLLCKQ